MFKREFCTTREAAEVLGVSLRTAQLWVDSGILQAWKTEGGHRRISVDSVEKLMRTGGSAKSDNVSGTKTGVPVDLTRLKILVVEDDNTLIKLYRTYIGSWNLPLQVSTAMNGYEALILIGREQPDLMIADLSMPGMDGFQMIRTLAGSSFREGMEIVVVTGMEDEAIAAQGGLPEEIKVFHKPIPFVELRAMVEAMMAERAALVQV
jgi:excisionase family DNA binding protein